MIRSDPKADETGAELSSLALLANCFNSLILIGGVGGLKEQPL